MLKKSLSVLALVSLAACAFPSKAPLMGAIYSDIHSGDGATSNPSGTKTGEACVSSILGVYAAGDASIETARRNGGITQITSVDNHTSNILGFYATHCTVVRGK